MVTNYIPHPIVRYFDFSHLPLKLQDISKKFYDAALYLDNNLPEGSEKDVALRKLLESKDAAVRAGLDLM